MVTPVAPFVLAADNFTPATRTPWGGRHIARRYKRDLLVTTEVDPVIGESWELSVGDELPSKDQHGTPLRALIAQHRDAFLGAEARAGDTTSLLVKILDTADDLSVQIHPDDRDPDLGSGNAGKTEAWFVVRADPDAVIYLGLKDDTTEAAMRDALDSGGDAASLLRKWSVRPGDFFVVEPGTPHAIGRGITLVEPQTATAGKRALTYRYWDWNRRYDARGKLDPQGSPRELHVERALAVTRWPVNGAARVPPMFRAGTIDVEQRATWQALCGPNDAACRCRVLRVGHLYGNGRLRLPEWNVLRALTVIEGEIRLSSGLHVVGGQTAVLPAASMALDAELTRAHAFVSAIAVT